MQFADIQEARDFLVAHPEVRSIELMLIDATAKKALAAASTV